MNINDHEDRSQLPDECEGATEAGSECMNLLCHEGCKLVAVLDGGGESATWSLEVENEDGEIVAMIEWPEVFGDWQTEGELIKKGFECRVA